MARMFAPAYGDDAVKVAMPAIQSTAWQLHEAGKSKVVAGHGRHPEAVSASRSGTAESQRHADGDRPYPPTASAA